MAAKKKKYRPKPVLLNPIGYVLEGLTKLTSYDGGGQYRKLLLRTYAALNAIRTGEGNSGHCSMLLGMLEVSEVLLHEHDIGTEYASTVKEARPAVLALIHRGEATTRFIATGPELVAITTLLELHEAQLEQCTVQTLDHVLRFLRKQNGVQPPWLNAA
jgi:hypothetical protein